MSLLWNDLDSRAVKTAKMLAADAVEQAGSGHPGTAMSLAPAAYLLYQRHLRFDPKDPNWLGRDRFVLSAGHASLTQYIQLYLAGLDMELEDLKNFRTFGAKAAGHPEYGHVAGVEITTGPLGSGLASAVGFALAARRNRGMLDPQAETESIFDHNVYVIAGDGCLQEGISAEACSLAGVQELGNLILIYDDNHISIEDDTAVAFNEDVLARFEAYGWHTQRVNWLQENGDYSEDVESLHEAIEAAKAETSKPSIIALRTIIGWPSPNKQNTGAIHGAKLGSEELAAYKQALGLDPEKMFAVDEEAVAYAREQAAQRGAELRKEWEQRFLAWETANPEAKALLDRITSGEIPALELPVFPAGSALATRAASGKVLNAIAEQLPEFWGGSADLAGSNNTTINGHGSFIPAKAETKTWKAQPYLGRTLHFGVREHAMGAIMNGIALDGLTKVFGGTFFVFADYMRGAVRLAALMQLPVTYVWTHDSIGVGEDGPTHQPVEHLTAYRAIPGLAMVRPMDANETAVCWDEIIRRKAPAGLVLTRQNLEVISREDLHGQGYTSAQEARKGAYIVADGSDVILIATGSEVTKALQARQELAQSGISARVVSVPCVEWFEAQDQDYKDKVLPKEITARVSIEAGLTDFWRKYVGEKGLSIGIDSFGLPGAADTLFAHYGITVENIVKVAKESLNR